MGIKKGQISEKWSKTRYLRANRWFFATRAIRSPSFFCKDRQERFAQGRSFLKIDKSNSLTDDLFKDRRERKSEFLNNASYAPPVVYVIKRYKLLQAIAINSE